METTGIPRLYTIGVYGYDAAGFFAALVEVGIDLFCDIRARRGVRGADYAFANSQRLQARLAELGIRYVHRPKVAPGRAIRELQYAHDDAAHIAKRQREALAPGFVSAYRDEILAEFDSRRFLADLLPAQRIVFCCVETSPAACHRSLLAARLATDLGLEVQHLVPNGQ